MSVLDFVASGSVRRPGLGARRVDGTDLSPVEEHRTTLALEGDIKSGGDAASHGHRTRRMLSSALISVSKLSRKVAMKTGAAEGFVRVWDPGGADSQRLEKLVEELASCRRRSQESVDAWLALVSEMSSRLPASLRRNLDDLKEGKAQPALIVEGLRVENGGIGPTPLHWHDLRAFDPGSLTLRHEAMVALLAQYLGDIFGYSTLQGGSLIHHVLPITGAETDQSGHGSEEDLGWHTEDAFTPLRADYLLLAGLRNHQGVATTLCGAEVLEALAPRDLGILREARFAVTPDEEHLRSRQIGGDSSFLSDGGLVPILRDGTRGPEILIDSVYMKPVDPEATAVFRRVEELIDSSLQRVAITAGQLLIIDNRRAVHGRDRFEARYDGADRWLLKASVADPSHERALRLAGPRRVLW